MSIEEHEKLEKGQSQMLKWLKGLNVGLVISLLAGLVYLVRKDGLTFDTQHQKQEVISNYKERMESHTRNTDIHMSFEEKKRLIILEQSHKFLLENQEKTNSILQKVGSDLQEIKTLTRRNN